LQPLQNLPAASEFDPHRPFPCPSARDCPTNGGLTNAAPPEPIDGRRAATQPTDNPACARAAHHTARRHAPSPRPRRDPPCCSSELPHECLTCPRRPSQSTGDAPRCSPPTIRRAHAAHTARRHAPSPRPRRDPPFVPPSCRPTATRMPHEPMPPDPIDGRRTATQSTDDPACACAATHRHRARHAPSPRPRRDPHVHPRRPFCSTRAAARPHEPMPPEPIDGRRTATQPTGRSIRGARRHAPSPRPRRDPTSTRAALLFHPSCRTASRANAARAYRRETHRDRRRTPPLLSTRVPALGQGARHATPACSERLGRAAVVCVRFRERWRDSGHRLHDA
jgi:hypothetical protein